MSTRIQSQGTYTSYTVGFVISILLTLGAYVLVVNHLLNGAAVVLAIAGLAVVQLVVQLLFFLHLGQESKPRWRSVTFLFMLMVLAIVVLGSLWIMNNLDYHMKSPADLNHAIIQDEGIKK